MAELLLDPNMAIVDTTATGAGEVTWYTNSWEKDNSMLYQLALDDNEFTITIVGLEVGETYRYTWVEGTVWPVDHASYVEGHEIFEADGGGSLFYNIEFWSTGNNILNVNADYPAALADGGDYFKHGQNTITVVALGTTQYVKFKAYDSVENDSFEEGHAALSSFSCKKVLNTGVVNEANGTYKTAEYSSHKFVRAHPGRRWPT